MTPERAREAYIELSRIGVPVGPWVFYNDADRAELENIQGEIGEANDSARHVGDRVFEVASPWHAYFFVQSLSYEPGTGTYTKYIYRGQSRPEKPIATLYRNGVNRDSAKAAFESVKSYARYYGLTDEKLFSEGNLLLMARHHGVPTSHLDFTVDPSVALSFAGLGQDVDGHSRIFVTQLNSALPIARLYVPPAYAQRLFVQRGVFLDVREADYPALYAGLVEVRFPKEYPFAVYRDGQEMSMYPDNALDNFFECLVTFARAQQDFSETGELKVNYTAELAESVIVKSSDMADISLKNRPTKDIERVLQSSVSDWVWMQAALIPSRIRVSDHGVDWDIDKEVVRALIRDNSYTYQQLLDESAEDIKSARLRPGWVEKLQQKLFDEFRNCLSERSR